MSGTTNRSAAELFNNPTLSDVVIKQTYNGKTREYYAHKAVLCMNSGYFLRAFTGHFKEATTNVMELHDDNPDDFEVLLASMYADFDCYCLSDRVPAHGVELFDRLLGIHVVADKYDVTRVSTAANNAIHGVIVDLQPKDLIHAIKAYYNDTVEVDSEIGRAITLEVLDLDPELMPTVKFKELLHSYPTFGADVGLAMLRNPRFAREKRFCTNSDCSYESLIRKDMESWYDCSVCGHPFV